MTWSQILLMFVGIPVGMFAAIAVLVFLFASARVPDGLARTVDPVVRPGCEARDLSGKRPTLVEREQESEVQ